MECVFNANNIYTVRKYELAGVPQLQCQNTGLQIFTEALCLCS